MDLQAYLFKCTSEYFYRHKLQLFAFYWKLEEEEDPPPWKMLYKWLTENINFPQRLCLVERYGVRGRKKKKRLRKPWSIQVISAILKINFEMLPNENLM